MNVKDVQNHLDFVRWPQNPSKIHHWHCAWVLRWFPSRWYTSDLGFYMTQWDQQRTSLCQKVEQKRRRAKMDGHQITHWDGAIWQGFHSPKKTCTIFKQSTILLYSPEFRIHRAVNSPWPAWSFQIPMTLQNLSGQDQLLLSSIMRFVTARRASRYASGTAGLWIRTRSCRTCSSWTLVVSERRFEVTSSLRIMKLRPLLKRYRPHRAILHSALLRKTWAWENTTFQQYGLCRICPCNARSLMLISPGISICSPAVLSRDFKIRAHAEPKNQGLCKFSRLAANHMQGASQELSGPTNRQDFR